MKHMHMRVFHSRIYVTVARLRYDYENVRSQIRIRSSGTPGTSTKQSEHQCLRQLQLGEMHGARCGVAVGSAGPQRLILGSMLEGVLLLA